MKLWDTYVDAAAQAMEARKYQEATLLLRSALQVVDQLGPQDPRPLLSRWLLDFARAEVAMDDAKAVAAVADPAVALATTRNEPNSFAALASTTVDETLLPFGRTLYHLADSYTKHSDQKMKKPDLIKAERLLDLVAALEKQGLWKDNVRRRGLIPFEQSLVMFDQESYEESAKHLETAFAIWEQDSRHAAALARNSQGFSVLPVQASENTESSYIPLIGLVLEGMAYLKVGEQCESDQPEKARDAYDKAEAVSKGLFELMASTWPGYPRTGDALWILHRVYLARKEYASDESLLRRSLELFLGAADTKSASETARDLAELLRMTNREREAAELERRYSTN